MPTTSRFTAILVAAGRSRRMGSDKLWTDFWGRPTWRWSLDVLLAAPGVERIAIAVAPDAVDEFSAALPPAPGIAASSSQEEKHVPTRSSPGCGH